MKGLYLKTLTLGPLVLSAVIFNVSCSQPPTLLQLKAPSVAANAGTGDDTASSTGDNSTQTATVPASVVVDKTQVGPSPVVVPAVDNTPRFNPCTEQSEKCHPHQMILADYALGKIVYVNLDDPSG